MVTPGVVVDSTPETFEPSKHPTFLIVTFRLLHSLRSMTPFPLPPKTAADSKTNFAEPIRHMFSVVVPPSVIVTITGAAGAQDRAASETLTV